MWMKTISVRDSSMASDMKLRTVEPVEILPFQVLVEKYNKME
jgi:hypothetical protein